MTSEDIAYSVGPTIFRPNEFREENIISGEI